VLTQTEGKRPKGRADRDLGFREKGRTPKPISRINSRRRLWGTARTVFTQDLGVVEKEVRTFELEVQWKKEQFGRRVFLGRVRHQGIFDQKKSYLKLKR